MKITLSLFGKEQTFSEEELVAILEKYFVEESGRMIVPEKPAEDKPFSVNPRIINRTLFMTERPDEIQENTRKRICEAFRMLDENPERYGKPFETVIPKKTWCSIRTAYDHIEWLNSIGEHMEMADEVEQAFEWAQRIQNGESWNELCNMKDLQVNKRLIFVFEKSMVSIVGGYSATYMDEYNYFLEDLLDENVVPLLIVRRT